MSVGERNYTVYMHVNKENDKCYIGITSVNVEKRWGNNGSGYKTQLFGRAIEKYGWDNFEHIILFENKTQEEAETLEKLYIKVLLSNNRTYGYNIENGGNSIGKISDETKQKMSNIRKGTKHTKETKLKMSKQRQDGTNVGNAKKVICNGVVYNCIKDLAEYYSINPVSVNKWLRGKRVMPQNFYNKGLRYLDEDNSKIKCQIELENEKNPNSKKVMCEDVVYDSLKECAKHYGINYQTMRAWVIGKNKMPQKFIDKDLHYLNETYEIRLQSRKIGKKVMCEGKIFNSAQECSEYYNIKYTTMASWLNGNRTMPIRFYKLELRYYDGLLNNNYYFGSKTNAKQIICNDILFNSILECAEFYKVRREIMNSWLLSKTSMPQKYIDLGLRYATEEDLNTHELVS